MKRGVDFDGTLAVYDGWKGPDVLGTPIPLMVSRVKAWLARGDETVILTARANPASGEEAEISIAAIKEWCMNVFGQELEVTCQKDQKMEEIFDDRAISVENNTGCILTKGYVEDMVEEVDGIGAFLK